MGLRVGQKVATVSDPPVVGVVVAHRGGFALVSTGVGVRAYRPAQLEPYDPARLLERATRKRPEKIARFDTALRPEQKDEP